MLEVQRTESLSEEVLLEAGQSPPRPSPIPDTTGALVSGGKPAERSVSFNRDVHVKRIGRDAPRITAALVGDGEGRLIVTPVRKESIASRSKEDLAEEAALVLEQAGRVQCVAHDNRRLPGRFSTLPARRSKKRPELPINVRRRSEEIGATTTTATTTTSSLGTAPSSAANGEEEEEDEEEEDEKEVIVGTPRAKKKALERTGSDAGTKRLRRSLARFFSPKLERKRRPVGRSASDAGTVGARSHRKRSGSDSEGSHPSGLRTKKQLTPIIEASPHVDHQQPFVFGGKQPEASRPEPKKSKQTSTDAEAELIREIGKETITEEIVHKDATRSGSGLEHRPIERRIEIVLEKPDDTPKKSNEIERRSVAPTRDEKSRSKNDEDDDDDDDEDDDDDVVDGESMLRSSRYDHTTRPEKSTTIHKMIHRLSNDRSPPPQLTRTMVSPGPGFGHNNNRPFSYTRPNESRSPPPAQTNVIYAQVQTDKKKAHRSHSDSDEGLGLERKDSSRENSPAEKEYRRTDYSYVSDLRRNNEINSLKSRYEEERKNNASSHFVASIGPTKDFGARTTTTTTGERPLEKSEKYTSTVFVDAPAGRVGRVDGLDHRRRDSPEFVARQPANIFPSKTSELSARRDLLESRIKSRLLADEMFAAKSTTANVPLKKSEHEIIDKPIVPSPVTPNRVGSPKRYTDTYITETRTNSNGERYIFEKEIHEDNGKVYGYEKKITNKIPTDGYVETKPRDGYTVETRTDKYGDKYIVETRTHGNYGDDYKPGATDRSAYKSSSYLNDRPVPGQQQQYREDSRDETIDANSSPIIVRKFATERKFSKSDDFLDRDSRPSGREPYQPRSKKSFESIRGMSKSTQRLDEVGENARVRALRSEYTSRSHENLSSQADYVNARDVRRPSRFPDGPTTTTNGHPHPHHHRAVFAKRHLESPRERPDDYDTDISQMTSSQLESKYYKETRTTRRYATNERHPLHDDYDSSPPRIRTDRVAGGYGSSRYDSDTTARDSSLRCENATRRDDGPRTATAAAAAATLLRKEHRKLEEEPTKPLRRSRNRLDYFDDSDARESPRGGKPPSESFDEGPTRPPRSHEGKSRHGRSLEARGHADRRHHHHHHHHHHHRETRLSDPDRKDRLADSGIENDYRRDSQEVDRREVLESEDEAFLARQFIKHERRHTDRSMNVVEQRKYDKYERGKSPTTTMTATATTAVTAKPPSGADKKYEKKAAKKSGTMSKVRQLFSKKEKKAKEERSKKSARANGASGALTDDELSMRYREYRGDQLRSAKSARDLGNDIDQEDYSQRRRLSTPSGSPSPPRPARLSRSTGTLTREDDSFRESNTLTRENQGQEAERKGWFKSLSRKAKSSAKPVDKKPRIPESEILTTGTEDEEASSAPERASVQKNLRFFGDTDQESVSSNRDRRNKVLDEQACNRRDVEHPSRRTLGILSSPRKPPRLAESALSSGESTTGDSSQQSQNSQRSQRSVVYLHAATVGEIPGPNERRRAASREELNRPLQSHTRTVSRSVSVLAPWKPRHYREPFEINYDQQQHQKPMTTMRHRQRSRETLNRRGKEARRSKDNLSKTGTITRSTLKSKDKQKVDRTVSTESLAPKSRAVGSRAELSRSTSVPRDPNKSAGWFKLKSKKSRA